MFADTDVVRALGAANSTQAADLATIAATLASLPTTTQVMGPVGARFLTALAQAAARESDCIAALRDRVAAADGTARFSAAAYETADRRVGASLPRI